jgi:hypothetical protein
MREETLTPEKARSEHVLKEQDRKRRAERANHQAS